MAAKKATFKSKLFSAGKTATGMKIPAEVVESFGVGKKPPVHVTINGYTYRNTVAVYGGEFMIGVSAEHRAGAHVKAGDMMEVTLELDTAPRGVEVPADFQKALGKNAVAKKKFETLSYSNKQGYVLPIKDAKTDETRQRRIEKAIAVLSQKKI
jgi:hypothetical protein